MHPTRLLFAVALLALAPSTGSAQDAQVRLWDAAIAGDTARIRAAVNDGAVIDSTDYRSSQNGRRPLNYAAINNHVDAIRLLLALGAPIDASNRTGFTPLHHAAEEASLEAARVLLEAGASTTLVNVQGMTALDVAREHFHTAVGDLIAADTD